MAELLLARTDWPIAQRPEGGPKELAHSGYTYEDAVAAHYLAAMVAGTTAAALDARGVQRVAQQQADFGEPLDDVIVDAASLADGTVMRLSPQVKRSLTISDAATNSDFRDVIQRRWQTPQKPVAASLARCASSARASPSTPICSLRH